MEISFRNVFYVLASLFGFLFLLDLGQKVLVPLAFALLIAFILYPIATRIEGKNINRLWSTCWTLLISILFTAGLIYLFSAHILKIIKQFDDFTDKLSQLTADVAQFINKNIPFAPKIDPDAIIDQGREWLGGASGEMLSDTLSSTSVFITGLVLTIIYTFLILLYRRGLKDAFIHFAADDKRPIYNEMLIRIQKVGQQYITGMFVLIVVLGILNSAGLFFLGIDYPLFFGFLAAFLSIIPYVGTTLGGIIPTIYALINYDSIWYPIGVILIFWFIQFFEGNFLNPRIVGGNLNLNALVAIISLILGGVIWGIPGMILFLPYTAVFKVICTNYKSLKPIALVLDDNLYPKKKKVC
jgi:predicted PurR-regulated permease PerM